MRYVDPYIERGHRSELMKKITVSVPLHVLKLLSDERTRRQIQNLRHATNSELLCEAFLHAFTGQKLPTDEELQRMKAASKSTKKVGTAKAAAKPAKKSAKRPAKKTAKAAAKKPAKKAAAKKKTAAKKKPAKKAAKK